MKSFKETLTKLQDKKAKGNLSFADITDLVKAFSELPEADQEKVQADVDEVVSSPEPTKKDGGEEAPKTQGNDEGIDNGEFSEIKEENAKLRADVQKMKAKIFKEEISKEFDENFAYTGKEDSHGIFNAVKHKDSFVDFSLTLTPEQRTSFYEILKNANENIKEKMQEFGHNGKGAAQAYSENMTESEASFHEQVMKVAKEKGIPYSQAAKQVSFS
jgi:hypothetical protein